jgi:hypothetical protein
MTGARQRGQRRHLSEDPEYTLLRRYLVAALGSLCKRNEAGATLQKFLLVAPRMLEAMVRQRPLYVRPGGRGSLTRRLSRANVSGIAYGRRGWDEAAANSC